MDGIRDRISESNSDVIYLQETKEHFDPMFIRNFCHPSFDKFEFVPFAGASGGIIIVWKSSVFRASFCTKMITYALSVEFSSLHNGVLWVLTNVYAPCTQEGKRDFLDWFRNIQMPDLVD